MPFLKTPQFRHPVCISLRTEACIRCYNTTAFRSPMRTHHHVDLTYVIDFLRVFVRLAPVLVVTLSAAGVTLRHEEALELASRVALQIVLENATVKLCASRQPGTHTHIHTQNN